MPSPAEWATYGSATAALIGAAVILRKAGPEARKLNADAGANLADAGVRMSTARELDNEKLRRDVDGLLARERERDRLAVRHERWDLMMAEKVQSLTGQPVAAAPPLWIEPQTG